MKYYLQSEFQTKISLPSFFQFFVQNHFITKMKSLSQCHKFLFAFGNTFNLRFETMIIHKFANKLWYIISNIMEKYFENRLCHSFEITLIMSYPEILTLNMVMVNDLFAFSIKFHTTEITLCGSFFSLFPMLYSFIGINL